MGQNFQTTFSSQNNPRLTYIPESVPDAHDDELHWDCDIPGAGVGWSIWFEIRGRTNGVWSAWKGVPTNGGISGWMCDDLENGVPDGGAHLRQGEVGLTDSITDYIGQDGEAPGKIEWRQMGSGGITAGDWLWTGDAEPPQEPEGGACGETVDDNRVRYPIEPATSTATASAYYDGQWVPGNAKDGNAGTSWAPTQTSDEHWWKLDWDEPQEINRVLINSRNDGGGTLPAGQIEFSSGDPIDVEAIAQAAADVVIDFPNREVDWIKWQAGEAYGSTAGIAEVEAYRLCDPPEDTTIHGGSGDRGGGEATDPDSVGGSESCGFNMYCWIKAALRWAFVPGDATASAWQQFKETMDTRPPFSIAVAGFGWLSDALDAAGGWTMDGTGYQYQNREAMCHHLGSVFDDGDVGFEGPHFCVSDWIHEFDEYAPPMRALLTVAVYASMLFALWKMFTSSFGHTEPTQPDEEVI